MNISESGTTTTASISASPGSISTNEPIDEKVTGKRGRLTDVTDNSKGEATEKKTYNSFSLPVSALPHSDFKPIEELSSSLKGMKIDSSDASTQRILKPQARRPQVLPHDSGP
ncbi:MAG: hypothetical protein DVB29_07265 [Verrucomicrobia bacterium]|nr:MAG: hypothetical protein DVB29_07265 [Verrucomicrobiota bacterium]